MTSLVVHALHGHRHSQPFPRSLQAFFGRAPPDDHPNALGDYYIDKVFSHSLER